MTEAFKNGKHAQGGGPGLPDWNNFRTKLKVLSSKNVYLTAEIVPYWQPWDGNKAIYGRLKGANDPRKMHFEHAD